MRDIVSVNAECWEQRIRNHRRCHVDNAVVVIVRFSFLGEVAEIINETVEQPIMSH
jgi:hypothetical protein